MVDWLVLFSGLTLLEPSARPTVSAAQLDIAVLGAAGDVSKPAVLSASPRTDSYAGSKSAVSLQYSSLKAAEHAGHFFFQFPPLPRSDGTDILWIKSPSFGDPEDVASI